MYMYLLPLYHLAYYLAVYTQRGCKWTTAIVYSTCPISNTCL